MSGAAAARQQLFDRLRTHYAEIHRAGAAISESWTAFKTEADLVQAIQAAGRLIVAAEQLSKTADDCNKFGRQILAEIMYDTGCTHCSDGELSLYVSRKRKVLIIDDIDRIPPQFLRQPPPEPDRQRIKDAIASGEDIPGVHELTPNEPQLNIRVERPHVRPSGPPADPAELPS